MFVASIDRIGMKVSVDAVGHGDGRWKFLGWGDFFPILQILIKASQDLGCQETLESKFRWFGSYTTQLDHVVQALYLSFPLVPPA